MRRLSLAALLLVAAAAQASDELRVGNTVITALSPDIIRVQAGAHDHSYAVINRDFGDPHAIVTRSAIKTPDLQVTIDNGRLAFATSKGESLDQDISVSGTHVAKRLRDDEHIYALGEKTGPLDKRGWKLGGYSYTMWNSDTFGYDQSTDPIYVAVPFYIVLRHGVAFGIFFDNTYRSN